jgi:phosphate transport system permease protein
MDKSPVLPVTIYRWAQDENPAFENLAAAAIIVLLVFLLLMNSIAIFVRNRAERKHA